MAEEFDFLPYDYDDYRWSTIYDRIGGSEYLVGI